MTSTFECSKKWGDYPSYEPRRIFGPTLVVQDFPGNAQMFVGGHYVFLDG